MDFWTDIAFTIVLRILKDKKESAKFRDVLYKIHGKIETMFPELALSSAAADKR